ncbi:hypothetical protein [Burkholderia gladioli]|uniref:hypothetical protein n=1 Tax=Burkholderia gladioli TaxID=28095 RepID=UPI002030E253|nr:hypothetical protein [Burkholderia gladioli]URV27527.1 hypothetical protein NAL90_30895 [Burkholderia gladioli]
MQLGAMRAAAALAASVAAAGARIAGPATNAQRASLAPFATPLVHLRPAAGHVSVTLAQAFALHLHGSTRLPRLIRQALAEADRERGRAPRDGAGRARPGPAAGLSPTALDAAVDRRLAAYLGTRLTTHGGCQAATSPRQHSADAWQAAAVPARAVQRHAAARIGSAMRPAASTGAAPPAEHRAWPGTPASVVHRTWPGTPASVVHRTWPGTLVPAARRARSGSRVFTDAADHVLDSRDWPAPAAMSLRRAHPAAAIASAVGHAGTRLDGSRPRQPDKQPRNLSRAQTAPDAWLGRIARQATRMAAAGSARAADPAPDTFARRHRAPVAQDTPQAPSPIVDTSLTLLRQAPRVAADGAAHRNSPITGRPAAIPAGDARTAGRMAPPGSRATPGGSPAHAQLARWQATPHAPSAVGTLVRPRTLAAPTGMAASPRPRSGPMPAASPAAALVMPAARDEPAAARTASAIALAPVSASHLATLAARRVRIVPRERNAAPSAAAIRMAAASLAAPGALSTALAPAPAAAEPAGPVLVRYGDTRMPPPAHAYRRAAGRSAVELEREIRHIETTVRTQVVREILHRREHVEQIRATVADTLHSPALMRSLVRGIESALAGRVNAERYRKGAR